MCRHPGAGFLVQSLLLATANSGINKIRNAFFVVFPAFFYTPSSFKKSTM
jgi:hypothetical protein